MQTRHVQAHACNRIHTGAWNLIMHSRHSTAVQLCMQLYLSYCQSCISNISAGSFVSAIFKTFIKMKKFHWKGFAVTYSSAKLFHLEQIAPYGIDLFLSKKLLLISLLWPPFWWSNMYCAPGGTGYTVYTLYFAKICAWSYVTNWYFTARMTM